MVAVPKRPVVRTPVRSQNNNAPSRNVRPQNTVKNNTVNGVNAPAKKKAQLREPVPPPATRRVNGGQDPVRVDRTRSTAETIRPDQQREEITRATERARAEVDQNRRLDNLPSFRGIERERQREERRVAEEKRATQEAERRNRPEDPFLQPRIGMGVRCADCHPDPQPFSSASNGLDSYFQRGTPLTADAARSEIDRRFETGAHGLDPSGRAELADGYAEKLAGEAADPNDRWSSRDSQRAREREKASNEFRLREADRTREAAGSAPAAQADAMRQRADDLVRRPLTPAGDEFLSALERTPTNQLSKNDVDDGMDVVRRHRAADHDKYDEQTGLAPGHDDMFVTREQEAQLFDANRQRDLQMAHSRLNSLGSKNCMDCHPEEDRTGFSLSGFDLDRNGALDSFQRDRPQTERERIDSAIDEHIRADPNFRGADPTSERYQREQERLRGEHELGQRIRANPSDPSARLKLDRDQLNPEQQRVLADHEAAFRYNELESKLTGPQRSFATEYKKNGWGEDSRFYGANDAAFLADLSGKDPKTISRHDAFRGLNRIDEYRNNNPEVFERHDQDFRSRADGSDLYYENIGDIRSDYDRQIADARRDLAPREFNAKRAELERQYDARRSAIGDDPNNPMGYLKTPIADLDDAQARIVNGDYTRHQVEKLEHTLRGQTVNGLADEVTRLDDNFADILDHQGIVGGGANWMKNHVGRDGGWIVDSNLGSDAVERTIQDAHVAADRVRELENFEGTNAEFMAAYQDRVGNLHESLQGVQRHVGKFEQSQDNWVEGVSTAVSVVGAAAAAAATGGTAAPLLVGALAGAGLKVGVKGVDAFTGDHAYQGSVGVDLLKGGLNGVSAAGTGMLARHASNRLLAAATTRLGPGQTLGFGTRAGVWMGSAVGEGATDGYIAGTGNALIDGKSFSEANRDGLQGLALGAALGPVGRGSMEGLGFLWKSAVRPSGLPKDVPIDWRGRPIGADGQVLPTKKDWRGRVTVDTEARPPVRRDPALADTDVAIPAYRPVHPIDAPPKPYEALPPATGRPDGENLTARVDGYNQVHDPNFTRGMASAIGEAETTLRNLADANGNVTPQQVGEVLDQIGTRRRELQHARVDREVAEAAANGQPWPAHTIAEAHAHADMYGAPLPGMRPAVSNQMMDQVLVDNRHAAYVDRARDATEMTLRGPQDPGIEIPVDGVPTRVPLSSVMHNPWHQGGYLTVHPDFDQSRILSNRANELIADVINDTTLTEAQGFRKMAEANYLMMHGTPFQLGSPASVEAMNDAVMRMRFNKTMPPKRVGVEPFWEAMFAPPGQAGLDRYVNAYRQFFE